MTESVGPDALRASDAEREEFASVVREAVGEGRLSLNEGEERLGKIYEARFREELPPLIRDLPGGSDQADQPGDAAGGGPWGGSWSGGPWSGGPWGNHRGGPWSGDAPGSAEGQGSTAGQASSGAPGSGWKRGPGGAPGFGGGPGFGGPRGAGGGPCGPGFSGRSRHGGPWGRGYPGWAGPGGATPGPWWRGPLGRHITFVVIVTSVLIGIWAISAAHFFWPAIPLVFLTLGLVRHARWHAWATRR